MKSLFVIFCFALCACSDVKGFFTPHSVQEVLDAPEKFSKSPFQITGYVQNSISIFGLKGITICDKNGGCLLVKTKRNVLPQQGEQISLRATVTEPMNFGGRRLLVLVEVDSN